MVDVGRICDKCGAPLQKGDLVTLTSTLRVSVRLRETMGAEFIAPPARVEHVECPKL